MANNKLEITYIIKAVDQATKNIEKIDAKLKAMEKSMRNVDKATAEVEKEQKSLGKRFQSITEILENTIGIVKDFYKALTSFDFGKFVRILRIVALLLQFKGMSGTAAVIRNAADRIEDFGDKMKIFKEKVEKAKEEYGGLMGYFYDKSGLKAVVDTFKSIALKVAGATAAFLALSASSSIINLFTQTIVRAEDAWLALDAKIWNSLGQRFPKVADALLTVSDRAFRGFVGLRDAMQRTNSSMRAASATAQALAKDSLNLGKTTLKAAAATEFAHKGFISLAAQSAAVGSGLAFLGKILVDSDSKLLKFTGTVTLVLAALAGFTAYIIRAFVGAIGQAVEAIGVKLVRAMESSIEKFTKLSDATASFLFLVRNLQEASGGATGSVETWSNEIDKVSERLAFTKTELRKAVGELVALGKAFHLNEAQMKTLLPIIADVAAFSGDNLFDATMRVTEAIGGMTQATAKYGIVLSEETILHSKYYKELGKKLSTLSEAEKAQLRYNVMLEKTATIQGYAANSLDTYAGAARRSEVITERVTAALGSGAIVFEEIFTTNVNLATDALSKFSEATLRVLGFLSSFFGRILQGIGLLTQWAFAIILTSTSIKALNILLADKTLSVWTANIGQAVVKSKALAAIMPTLSVKISEGFLGLSSSLLKVNSVLGLMKLGFMALGKAVLVALAPLIVIGIKIAAVAAAFYVLYKAFELIEQKTQIFSALAEQFKGWFALPGVMDTIKEVALEMAQAFSEFVAKAIIWTAKTIIRLSMAVHVVKLAFIDFINLTVNKILEWRDKITGAFERVRTKLASFGNKVLSVIGITSAFGAEVEKVKVKVDKPFKPIKIGKDMEKNSLESLNALDNILGKLEQVDTAVKKTSDGVGGKSDKIKELEFIFAKETELKVAQDALDKQRLLDLKEFETLDREERFNTLVEAYGVETALKMNAEVEKAKIDANAIKDDKKRKEAYYNALRKMGLNNVKATEKIEQEKLKIRIATTKASANLINALSQAAALGGKKTFGITKALAMAAIPIDTAAAIMNAMTVKPAHLAVMQATTAGIMGAVQLARVASSKPPSYYNSGIIPGPGAGDQVSVNANGGEVMLNKSDQKSLLDIARFGSGGDSGMAESMNNLADAIRNQTIVTEIDGREVARTVRDQVQSGYQLA